MGPWLTILRGSQGLQRKRPNSSNAPSPSAGQGPGLCDSLQLEKNLPSGPLTQASCFLSPTQAAVQGVCHFLVHSGIVYMFLRRTQTLTMHKT